VALGIIIIIILYTVSGCSAAAAERFICSLPPSMVTSEGKEIRLRCIYGEITAAAVDGREH